MRGLPQKQNARRADKIRLCGHLGRYKKIVKKTYIIFNKSLKNKLNWYSAENFGSTTLELVTIITFG